MTGIFPHRTSPVLLAPRKRKTSTTVGSIIPSTTNTPGPLGDSRDTPQIGWFTWFNDYPAPSNTIDELLSCRSFSPRDPTQINFSEFCDPKLDALMKRAARARRRTALVSVGAAIVEFISIYDILCLQ
jgi:ABC-type transport system substrate-binding protein